MPSIKLIGNIMSQANQADNTKPFSREYVLRTTARHMAKAVDLSIEKTMARLPEFEGNADKGLEILKTLSDLKALRGQINTDVTV